ncbi:hypothetical protein GF412_00155 [Candidatus Micrarchaeota archaeon]|nr:hypothetical protein [Candidatus Micrarchaeota archaeon]MBD3417387.1 hypothetical protein [Candidatus Micrarchaeota archaeon]
MRVGPGIALILLILSMSFASGPEPHVGLPSLGLELIAFIAITVAMLLALSSMIGQSLQNSAITAWSKVQVRELIVSVILAVLIWGVVTGSNTMISAIFLSTGEESLVDLGSSALDGLIGYQESLYHKVADAYLSVGVLQGTSYYSVASALMYAYLGTGYSPTYGISILMGPLSVAANNLTTQMLTFKLVKVFLGYIEVVVPGFLLPIALAMRIFPFSRNAGNTLIALCLGGLFVLPISLMLVGEFFGATTFQYADVLDDSFKIDEMGATSSTVNFLKVYVGAVCKNYPLRVFSELGEIFTGIIYGLAMMWTCGPGAAGCFFEFFMKWVLQLWPYIITIAQAAFSGSFMVMMGIDEAVSDDPQLSSIVYKLIPAVTEVTAFSIVSFVMIVFITFGGVRAISSALGGEQVLYGLSRFV